MFPRRAVSASALAFAIIVVVAVIAVGFIASEPLGISNPQPTSYSTLASQQESSGRSSVAESSSSIFFTTWNQSSSATTPTFSVGPAYAVGPTTFSNGTVKTVTVTLTVSSTASQGQDPCAIAGPPDGADVRLLFDNGSAVMGAQVNASLDAGGDVCNQVLYPGQNMTTSFTTGSSWHSLPLGEYGGSFSFTAEYQGHYYAYNIHAYTQPISTTCVTLYIPSARSNVTEDIGSSSCD
jgi:hypothetical protein